jgi:uncharacterized integral membrane protein
MNPHMPFILGALGAVALGVLIELLLLWRAAQRLKAEEARP